MVSDYIIVECLQRTPFYALLPSAIYCLHRFFIVPVDPVTKKPQRERYNLGWNKVDFTSGWPVLV